MNRLLSLMAPADFEAVMREARIESVSLGARLCNQDQPVDAVYFPLDCMVSLLATSDGECALEMATIGREGVIGAVELLSARPSMGVNLVQIPGRAVRIDGAAFRELANTRRRIADLIQQHTFALLRQVQFGAACNRLHSMEERCARWLLLAHDRAGIDTFPATQEVLSHMLGVRRATVNMATASLKKSGYIHYVRGRMRVLDRRGLESAACECYSSIVSVYDTVWPKTAVAPGGAS